MDWTGFGDFVRDVGGVVIGLAGTVVAGLALVLTHRERTARFRSHLFEKQIEALTQIADSAAELLRYTFTAAMEDRNRDPNSALFDDLPARQTLIRLKQKSQVILPATVNEAIEHYMAAAWEVTGMVVPGERPTPANFSPTATEAMHSTYRELIDSIRNALGVDELSDETLQLVSRHGGRHVADT